MSDEHAPPGRAYTLREASGILGVSVTALRRRVAAGQIKAERVERPQGSVWRVYLDAYAPGQAPRVTVSERDTLKAPRDRPQFSAGDLVSLVRELSEKLAESAAVAAMWQERARVLGEQLALAAPAENPVAGQQVPAVPLTTRLRALAPWALLLAIMLVVVLLGWPG